MISYVKQQSHGGKVNFKSFIQTRAQLTREPLSISFWRLVNSHLNPADIVSKSFLFNAFVKNDVRFKGPTFLPLPECGWPQFTIGNKSNFDISKEGEKCGINSVYNKDSNECVQSIALQPILNNQNKVYKKNPVSDGILEK